MGDSVKLTEREAQTLRAFTKAVLHGDDEHREWLTEAVERFIAKQPLPPPRGKGTAAVSKGASR